MVDTQIARRLEASREALMQALAGMDETAIRARPVAGAWTCAEVLAHLLNYEQTVRETLHSPSPVTSMTDDERQAGAKQAQRMAIPQIVHGIQAQRRETIRMLQATSSKEHERHFDDIAQHEMEHAKQIEKLRAAAGEKAPSRQEHR